MIRRPWRTGVAVVNLHFRPPDLTHPGVRPSLLLLDAGFEVHVVTRGDATERVAVDGAVNWVEPGTGAVVRRITALRPELLFVESGTYSVMLGAFAGHSWIRNPQPAADPRLYRLQRTALRTFDAVSFTNPAAKTAWKSSPERLADLPFPLDVNWWGARVERRASWWTERGWPVPEGPVLVCNSSFERNKRHEELLDWLAPTLVANPSMTLVLFGHRWKEPHTWEMARTRPATLGIAGQVRVTDWVPYPEIRELLAWASLTVINSSSETQCLAVYEALAAGVPTLISSIPSLTSQFPHLPAHADGHELRANVDRVLADQQFGQMLVESSRDQVAWADVARHDDAFYATLERLLGRGLRMGSPPPLHPEDQRDRRPLSAPPKAPSR